MGDYGDVTFWLVLLIVCGVVEIATLGLTTIWFAAGALIALVVAVFTDNVIIEAVTFFVISFVMLFFTRPIAQKHLNNKAVRTNVESMIGKTGKVVKRIDNITAAGLIVVDGNEWSARSDSDFPIEEGVLVEVLRIEGVKAIVREKSEKND